MKGKHNFGKKIVYIYLAPIVNHCLSVGSDGDAVLLVVVCSILSGTPRDDRQDFRERTLAEGTTFVLMPQLVPSNTAEILADGRYFVYQRREVDVPEREDLFGSRARAVRCGVVTPDAAGFIHPGAAADAAVAEATL